MPIHVKTQSLSKKYFLQERSPGLKGALLGLFKRKTRVISAVEDVNLTINHGEIVGYIGPNGAGKSTTIKMIAGILVPTSGTCEVNNLVPWKNRTRHVQNIGVVFGQRSQLWWDLPVIESFKLLADIYRVSSADFTKRLDELVALLSLEDLLKTPVRLLSLGQKMRCEFVAALLHAPSLLILDEPTVGLDAISKLNLREFLRNYNKKYNATIFLTTHDLDDIEALCERVVVINTGKLVFDGTLQSLRDTTNSERRITVDFQTIPGQLEFPNLRLIYHNNLRAIYAFNPAQITATQVLNLLGEKNIIHDLTIENPPIDEVISSFYQRNFPC